MPKASRVRYNGTAPFIDDVQGNRIQALGSSSRLTTEDMKELGTLNIVEIVDDVPQVDISIDANENGTTELVSLLSNTAYGCNVVAVPSGNNIGSLDVKVRPGAYLIKGQRVLLPQTKLTATASGNQFVYLNPEVSGTKVAIGTSVPGGAIKIADIVPSGGMIRQENIVDQRPFKQTKELDFELANVDIYVPIKQSGSGDTVQRTMYMERAYVNNIDFSFQVNGVATTSFRLEADNKRWFLNNAAQIVVDEFKSTGTTTITLSQTPFQMQNGQLTLECIKNGVKLDEGPHYTVNGGTKTLTFVSAPANGDLIKVRYCAANGGKFFAPVPALEEPHPELAGGIKEGQIELYIVDKNGVADPSRTTRVQSARISLPLGRDQLDELGSSYPYERPLQLPVNSTVSLELKDSDLEMMARMAGYTNLATVSEISIQDLVKDQGLLVKIFRETDVKRAKLPAGHPDKYAIKTYYIKNLIPQSESWDVRVDSDATQSFEFLAHNLTVSDEVKL